MKFTKTQIPEVVIIEPTIFEDERGYFYESFSQEKFDANIGITNFIQDNESKSTFGVLRGLHFQKPPFAQAKLVRCIKGAVLDIVVDLRKNIATYGKHIAVKLSEQNKKQLFVPRGFAHGFIVLSQEAVFSYKVDNIYAPSHEDGILWNDKTLDIDWNIQQDKIILSAKDKILSTFKNFNSPF